jgi:phage anti-repressor protein
MKELIKITEDNGKRAVSARELHAFLESKQQFTDWIKNRIEQYGLVENEDFVTLHNIMKRKEGVRGASKMTEYALSMDCAKELAMVEGNEKGKQARRYFIKAEKVLREIGKGVLSEKVLSDIESRINRLEARNNFSEVDGMTIYGFSNMQRKRLYGSEAMTLGKHAVKLCKESGEEIGKIKDARFGWVNVYPEWVLETVFEDYFKNPRF